MLRWAGRVGLQEVYTIYSKHHFLISLVVGLGAAALAPPAFAETLGLGQTVAAVFVGAYATALGVLIDLDHFLLARVNTGSWRAVRYCLRHPRAVFVDQRSIFEDGDVGVLKRLLSHVVVGGVLVTALAVVLPYLAVVSAATLYAHLLADLVWDNWWAGRVPTRDEVESEAGA